MSVSGNPGGVSYSVGAGQEATFIVAASNSINSAGANYVCSGTNDDVVINTALAALPSFGQAGARAGKVLLRAGTYSLGASVIIDGDYTTLEGENFPMWGGYNASWTGTGSPAGAIGVGPAKLQAASTGFDIISLQNNNIPSGTGSNSSDQNRHRGICIRNLYLVGDNYSAQGISTTYGASPLAGGNDWSLIENCMIQRCSNAINVGQDSWTIRNNSIQDCSGGAILFSGTNGTIIHNLIYDIGGIGVQSYTGNCIIEGNRIGDVNQGILISTGDSAIANQITNTSNYGIDCNGTNISITGNTIQTNCSGGGAPITCNNNNYNVVCGNTIVPNNGPTGTSGAAAIYIGSGIGNSISGNNISGTFSSGNVLADTPAHLAANYIWHNEPYATLNGTSAGTVVSSQSLQGNSKRFVANFSGYENSGATNQLITFTIPFVRTPFVTVNTLTSSQTVSITSAAMTIVSLASAATSSGIIIAEGQ